MTLTPKQQAFCDYYIENPNATEAAIRAGYSEKTARQLAAENLSKPYIREYIDARMKQKEISRIASQDEVLEFLTKVLRGQSDNDTEIDVRERIKAAELLGKRYLLWTDKQVVDGAQKVTIVEDMTADGLDDAIERGDEHENQPS